MVEAADHSNQPIFPQYKTPYDWPWTINVLVSEARRIISYYKHLPDEQQPPRSIQHSAIKSRRWIENHMPGKKQEYGNIAFDEHEVER